MEPNGDTREFFYDPNRRLRREKDELGNFTTYTRDRAGRVTRIREDATGAETESEHDADGRVTKRIDPYDRETTMTYRAGGRLATLTDPGNHTRSFEDTPTSRTVVDALSRTTVRHMNAYGLTMATTLPGGTGTSLSYVGQTRMDESQRFPLEVVDEGSRVRSYGYDTHQGMTSASDLGGENDWNYTYGLTRGAQIVWDAESGSVELAPVDARASAYEFSGVQGIRVQEGDFKSDGLFTSELKTVTTPSGDTTTFERDSAGRPSVVTLPWGAQTTYTYASDDVDALPETVTLPQGTTLTYSYDDAGREISRTSSDGESRSFVYGPGDRIESMTDATGTTVYEYDAAGRFAGIVYPHGGSVRYQRDLLGRTIKQEVRATAVAAPIVTQYAYDQVGNLSVVLDPLGGETILEYDGESRLKRRALPNGVVTTYSYDARDRPLSVVHANAQGVVLASREYVRAPGGEPTKITKQDGSWVEVGYDSALRITSERYFDADGGIEEEIAYAYDADGNRVSKTVDGVVSTYSYESGARLTEVTTSDVTASRLTDNGGRETQLVVGCATATLTYDSDDHVTRIVKGSQTTTYEFDAEGRRVAVTEAGVAKRFLTAPNMGDGYDSPQAITDGGGAIIASFVFAGEHPIMKLTPSGPVYYLADAMGSVMGTAGAAGTPLDSFEYDGFGNERGPIAGLPVETQGEFRFQGMWKDATGLYYVRARVYDAATGRFTSMDAASGDREAPETYYPYAFANSSPTTSSDPSGYYTNTMAQMAALAAFTVLALTTVQVNNLRCSLSRPVSVGKPEVGPTQSADKKYKPGRDYFPNPDPEVVPLFHGSINHATQIRESGFDLDSPQTPYVSRDRRAAEDAISPARYDVQVGNARDPGVIESDVPKVLFEAHFAPYERPYRGFFPYRLSSTEIPLTERVQRMVFNAFRVR